MLAKLTRHSQVTLKLVFVEITFQQELYQGTQGGSGTFGADKGAAQRRISLVVIKDICSNFNYGRIVLLN